ncbi:g219 [Coccomyxa elongata]
MNALFGTTFEEMDAMSGRRQTTKGIWLAKGQKIEEPATLVLDLEGSDGRERGEDDNSFERQSSLFALAVADVLLVNMWAKDVGREAGAGKPLLKTIFQVNLKLFTPAPNKRRTVLLFVFRDRTKTPLARLIETWEEDLRQMWGTITKPPDYEQYSFTDFFEVKYSSLPNFEEKEEDFRAESVLLRRRFSEDGEDSLVRVSDDKLPGHALALSLQKVWEIIRDQKDLNLPAHKVMVANIRCAEIMEDQLRALAKDQAWLRLREEATSGLVPNFGTRAAALLDSCLSGYDEEARYFEDTVRRAKEKELVARSQQLVAPAFADQLGLLQQAALSRVVTALAQPEAQHDFAACASRGKVDALAFFQEGLRALVVPGTSWDTVHAIEDVSRDIDAYINKLRFEKVAEVGKRAEKSLVAGLAGPSSALLDSCPSDLWPRLGRLLSSSLGKASQVVEEGLHGYEVPQPDLEALHKQLANFGRARIESAAREAANTALPRMKERFTEVFSKDEGGMPRTWGPRANIQAANQKARLAAAQLLAQLAVLRLDTAQEGEADVVEQAVLEHAGEVPSSSGADLSARPAGGGAFDMVAAADWPGLPEHMVLLSPSQCRTLWRQFSSDTSYAVQQAQATQEANRAASNKWPPFWAIAAMFILGFDEMMAVLYNPLWLILALFLFLFGKTVYQELDVDAEMQRGLLPGAVALSGKFVPVLQSVSQRTVATVREFLADPGAMSERVQDKLAATGNALREHVTADANSATATPSNTAGSARDVSRNGLSEGGVRKRRAGLGDVELTDRSEQTEATIK